MKSRALAAVILLTLSAPGRLEAQSLGDCRTLPVGSETTEIEMINVRDTPVIVLNSRGEIPPRLSLGALNAAISRNPDDAGSYMERGHLYCEEGDYDRAIADFNKAIERDSRNPAAYVALTGALWRRSDADEAIAALDAIVERSPDEPAAYIGRGDALFALHRFEQAIANYDAAIRLDATSDAAFTMRGAAYYNLDEPGPARADFDAAIRLNRDAADAYFGRGHLSYDHQDFSAAVADYTELIRIRPDDYVAFMSRGNAYDMLGDPGRAFADYDEMLRLGPDEPVAHYNRGVASYRGGDQDSAIADYDEALRLDPAFAHAFYARGEAYVEKGDIDSAIADYSAAIRIERDPKYYYGRAVAFTKKGQFLRALTDFGEVSRLDPSNPTVNYRRALLAFALGDIDQAAEANIAVLRYDLWEPNALYLSGLINLARDAPEIAARDFDRLLLIDPGDPQAALWRDIAERRHHLPGRLADAVSSLDMEEWPAPIVRFYLGQSTAGEVIAAADDADRVKRRYRLCEAHLFIGVHLRLHGDKAAARHQFEQAKEICDPNAVEHGVVLAELRGIADDDTN